VILDSALLGASELVLAGSFGANRSDDEAAAVGGEFELGVGCDLEQLEDGLVDDDAGAVANGLKTLDHGSGYNIVGNVGQTAELVVGARSAERGSGRPHGWR